MEKPLLHFKGPSFVLFSSYAVLGLYLAGLVLSVLYSYIKF